MRLHVDTAKDIVIEYNKKSSDNNKDGTAIAYYENKPVSIVYKIDNKTLYMYIVNNNEYTDIFTISTAHE